MEPVDVDLAEEGDELVLVVDFGVASIVVKELGKL